LADPNARSICYAMLIEISAMRVAVIALRERYARIDAYQEVRPNHLSQIKYDPDQCRPIRTPPNSFETAHDDHEIVGHVRGDRTHMTLTNSPLSAQPPQSPIAYGAAGADIPALARLRSIAQTTRLRRRQIATTNAPDTVYFVLSGILTAEHGALSAKPTMVELLYPGDIIAPALRTMSPEVTHTTMSPAELLRISASALKAEMANDPALTDFVFQQLNLQRARMQLHISMLAKLTSEERVAALLLQAACHLGTPIGGAISFDMPLSRSEVAEYLALNADTLSRIMSRLVRDNVLARSTRAQITIRDFDALKAHCPLSDAVTALHGNA